MSDDRWRTREHPAPTGGAGVRGGPTSRRATSRAELARLADLYREHGRILNPNELPCQESTVRDGWRADPQRTRRTLVERRSGRERCTSATAAAAVGVSSFAWSGPEGEHRGGCGRVRMGREGIPQSLVECLPDNQKVAVRIRSVPRCLFRGTEMPMDPLEVRGRRRWPTRVVLRAWVRRHRVVAMVVAVGCGWVMVGAAVVVMATLLSL